MEFIRKRGADEMRLEAWRRSLELPEYFQNLNLLKLSGGTFGDRMKMFRLQTRGMSPLSFKFWAHAVLLLPGLLTIPMYTLQEYRRARQKVRRGDL